MSSAMNESIYELQEHLESLLTATSDKSEAANWLDALKMVVAHIAGAFTVTDSEVAILFKTKDGNGLKFASPPALAKGANIIPLKVWSLAGNVVKAGTGSLDNNFTERKHLSIYEHIKIGGLKTGPIHKIIATAIKIEGEVFGVVEVSRKGKTPDEAGPDFTTADLALLSDIMFRTSPYLIKLQPKNP
jgi:hypothetical protein